MIEVVDWKLIGACNLKCLHCYGPPKNLKALPLGDLLTILAKFRKLGPKWIVMTGGEPLLVPQIDMLLERVVDSSIKVALSTNTNYFRRHQDSIERYGNSLNIPIDCSTPMIHSKSRQDETSYHTFFGVLRQYQDNPARKPYLLRVGTVFSKANQDDLVNIARTLEPFANVIDTWKIYELIDYEFEPEQRADLIHKKGSFEEKASSLVKETSLSSKISFAPAYSRDKAYFMVNPSGHVVVPTEREGVTFELPIGNLIRDPLEDIVERWKQQADQINYFQSHAHYWAQGTGTSKGCNS